MPDSPFIEDHGEKIPSVHSYRHWEEAFREYMESHRYSHRTVQDYLGHLGFLFRWLDARGINEIGDVKGETLHEFQNHLYYTKRKGKGLSLETQASRLVVVKMFFRFLCKANVLLYDPAAGLELPKRKKNLPQGIMTIKEVLVILAQPDLKTLLGLRDRAILELLYSSGIRNEELRNLTLLDVDFKTAVLHIREGKNAKSRVVPLGEVAAFYLKRYLQESRTKLVKDPENKVLFVTKGGQPIPAPTLVWIVKRYAKKAKINQEISPHSFRHTCATHMLKGKADLRHIQQMLGHASVESTEVYTHVEISDLKRVHRQCHPREKRWDPDGKKPRV